MAVNGAPSRWISHIAVVGFHHAHGNHVELMYPPVAPELEKDHHWEFLPFLAIPDGSHNSGDDYTFFILPKNDESPLAYNLYGVSCFRQIRASELPEEARTADITRTHIQKAVCIISYLPFFGPFHERLSVVTQYYFNQMNFANTEILESLFNSLEASYSPEKPLVVPDLLVGIPLRDMVTKFGRKTLSLFKLMMLEQGIVVFASQPIHGACTTVFGLLSLFPSGLNFLFPDFVPVEAKNSLHTTYGLPLQLFNRNCVFHPYVTLQQMDALNKPGMGFLAGTSNMLYLKNPPVSTAAIVDVGSGTVDFQNDVINRLVNLTSSDKRFMDDILAIISETANQSTDESDGTSWEGSDAWIRAQFEKYIFCLLNSYAQLPNTSTSNMVETIDLGPLDTYNQSWVRAWTKTRNFNQWKITVSAKREALLANGSELPPHPVGEPPDLLDELTDKVSSQLKDLEPKLTPLKQSLGVLTNNTFSAVRENALPITQNIGNITSNTLSSVKSNALSFSKFLTASAEVFKSNYSEQMGQLSNGDKEYVPKRRESTASNTTTTTTITTTSTTSPASSGTTEPTQPVTQETAAPTTTTTITPTDNTAEAKVTENTDTSTTPTTTTADANPTETPLTSSQQVTNNQDTAASTTSTASIASTSTPGSPTLNASAGPRGQESVAAVAKATAQIVSSTGRWFSAISNKVASTMDMISDALDEPTPNP